MAPIRLFGSALLAIWTKFPSSVRAGTYTFLQMIGRKIYGETPESQTVQRLPFGLYLKRSRDYDGFRNEFNAMKLVAQHTTIPVPRPIDVVPLPGNGQRYGYLLMGSVPGKPFYLCGDIMSDKDFSDITAQMQDYIAQ